MNIYVDANWDGASAAPEGYDAIYANLTDAVKAASTTEATTITVAAGTYSDSIGFYEENVSAATSNLSAAVKDIVEDCKAVGEQKGDIVIKAAEGADVKFTGHFLIGCNSRGTGGSGVQHWNSDITFQGITFDAEATEKHSIVVANMEGFTLDTCKIVGDGGAYGIGGSTNSNFGEKPVFKNCTFENTAIQGESQLGAKLVIDGGTFINSSINAPGGMEDTCMTISGATFQNTITEEGDFYVVRSNAYPVNISDCSFDLKIAEGVDASKVNGAIFVPRKGGDKAWNVENIAVTFDDAALNDADIYLCSPINGGNRMVIDGLTSSSNDVAELLSKTQGDLTVKQGDAEITYKDGVMSMPAFDGVDNLVICNLDDLKKFRDMVNAGENFKGKTITLAADIDLNNEEWTPIGTQSNKFLGNFDGAGHTIKNLVVDGDIYWGSGFFGNVTNGNPEIAHNVIKNLTIENASISGTHSVGAVAGSAFCTDVSNVAVIGNVNINGSWYVGAAFGRFEYGNLDGCVIDVTSGKVYSKDSNYIGGAIGFTAEGALKYSNISSNINVETKGDCDFVGGVFGLLHYNNSVDGVECNADSIVCENATTGAIAGAWGNEKGTTVVVKNATVGENTKVTVDGQEVETAIMGSPRFEETTESGSLAVVETNDKGEVTKVIEVSGPKGMETALNSGTTTMYVSMEDKDGNIDVFSSINEAMLAAQENGGGTIVMYGTNDAASVVDDTAIWRTNGTYTFTGGDYFNFNSWVQTPKSSEGIENVDVNIVFDDAKVVVGKFRLDTGSTLTITDTHMDGVSYINDGRTWLTFYGDSVINISNSVVGYKVQYNGDNSDAIKAGDKETDYSNVKGAMTFYGSGVLNVTDSTLFGYSAPSNGAVFAVTDKGLFTFTDSAIYGGSIAIGINDNVTVGRDGEVATMIFDNSEFNYINGDYQDPYACKITVGGDKDGKLIVRNNSEINFTNDETKGVVVNSNGEVEISNSKFNANAVTNNGAINVKGESTLKIDSLTGEEVNLLDGAIVKDSTVGGAAFVAGNVTFRGDNTFAMLYDYGVLTDYYGTTAPMKWTVEEGASLVLTDKARYGLGYGDVVTINGNIAKNGAAAARETLTDDNAENDVKTSLFMHGLVAQESKGWDCNSSLTVNNAYVQIGSNNSFGNKPGNYGGVYTIKFNNAVLDSSRITFYEALSQTTFTFTNSNAKVGTFMTNDADSVFTLDNTVLLSTTTTNGTDEGNYNAGELNVVNNSSLTYSADVTNKKGASINVEDSEFIAPALTNDGTFKVTGTKGSTLEIATVTGNAVQLAGAVVNSNVGGNIEVNGNSAIKADADETTEDVTTVTGIVKVVNGSTLTIEDGATLETKHIALGNDNYPTLNIGEVTGAEKGGNLVVEGTIATDKLNVNSNAAMTIEKGAVVTTGTIAIEDGGIAADENNKAGYLKIEDGGTLNTKYLNAFNGGKVDVEGTVNIGNDKRANYSTVVKGGGEVNVAATGLISGDGYNGKVEANGVLNINGGKVEFKDLAGQVTAEQGNFQNAGTVNVNGGTFDVDSLTNDGTFAVGKGESTLVIDKLTGNAIELAGTLVDSTIGGGVTASAEAGFAGENKVDSALFYDGADITVKEGADVDVANTLATYDGASLKVEKNAEIDAQSIYFNGGSIEVSGKLSAKNTNDGGLILNGADDTVTINKGGVLDVNYVDIYKTTGNSTVELYGDAKTSFKLSDGSGKFTWNIYDGGSLTAEKYGIEMNNAESAINIYGDVTAAQISNAGTINVNGGTFDVDVLSGIGTLNVGAAFDKDGNAVASTLNIGELKQDVYVNKDAEKQAVLTGSIDKSASKIIRIYNTVLDGFNVNADYEGLTVSATGTVGVYDKTILTGGTEMNLNNFQVMDDVEIAADATVRSANVSVFDSANNADAVFSVKGNLEVVSLYIRNIEYYAGDEEITSRMIVEKDGVVKGDTQNGHGLLYFQYGHMTVYGYVNGNWTAGGGSSYIGHPYEADERYRDLWHSTLTVDGTYASADSNNGKFVNVGDQNLDIRYTGKVYLVNNGLFDWAATVNNRGLLSVTTGADFVAGTLKNNGELVLDETAFVQVDTFTSDANGKITINVADTNRNAVATLIDANKGANFGNIVVDEADAAAGVDYYIDEENGDLVVYNKNLATTVYVNSEYSGNFGDKVADGKYFGINAFSQLGDVAATDNTKNLVIAGGNYNPVGGDWVSMLKGGINNVTTEGQVVVEKGNLYFNATTAGEYSISGDYVTTGLEGYDPWPTWATNGIVRFKGVDGTVFNITNANISSSAAIQFMGGKSIIAKDSILSGNAETESKIAVYGEVVNYGKMNVVTAGNSGTGLLIGHKDYADNANKLTVSGKDASVNVAVNGGNTANKDVDIHSSGTLIVEDGATFAAANDVNNAGSVLIDGANFAAGELINNNNVTLKGTATFDVQDFDNNATLTLDGFTGDLADSLAGDKQGIVEAFGTNVITDNINTMEMYFGQKLVGDEDDDFEKGRETNVAIGNEENKVTVNVETFYNKGTAATTVANGSTLNVGYIKNYGKLDVDGVVNLTTDASKGTSGIGRAEAAVGYDNTKSVINVTGEFNVNTNEGATENNFVIYDNTSLNVAGGKFNADENTSIINDGNFNLVGNVTVNITNYEGNAVNVAKGVVLNNSSLKADLNIAGNITVTDSTLSGKFTGKKVTVTLDGTNNIVLADDSNVALFFDGKNADVITEGSYFGKADISGKNNAVLTVDNDAFNGNKISGVKLNLTGFNFDEDSENYDVVSNVNVALDSILSINGVEVVKVVDSRIVEIDGVKYELLNTDKKITLNKISDDASSSVINVKTFSLGKGQDVDYSDYTFNMLSGNRKLDVKNDAVLKLAAITKEGKGVTNIVLGKNAELYVGNVEAIGKLSTGAGAAVEMGNVTATDANASIALGADNKASMADVDLKGGKNSVTIGARSTVDMASLAGAASINLASGTAAKYKKGVLVVDEVRTELNIAGDLNADAKGTAIKAGNYADLNVGGNMNDIASINIGTSAALKTTDINGTAKNNTLTFGKNASVDVQNIDLKDGKNAIVLNANVDFDADSISNVYKISTGKGSKFTVNNIVSENIANNYNFGANNEVDIKAIVMSATTKNSVKVGANSVFNVEENIAGAYRITTEKAALFNVNKISATELADVISFGANTVNNISAIDMAKGNDKLSLAANSRTFINTIAFGEGKDTLSFAKGAELSVDGGIISGLDVVSGNSSNVIYLYNDARLVDAVEVKNLNKINVVSAEYIDGVIGINQIGSLTYNGGNTEFDLLDNNGRDTFKLDGNSIFKIQSLDDVKVSYLKNGVWYDLVDPMIAIENAEMVSVSLKEFDKKPKGEIEYTYSITSL